MFNLASALGGAASAMGGRLRPQRGPSVMSRGGSWVPPDNPDAVNDLMQQAQQPQDAPPFQGNLGAFASQFIPPPPPQNIQPEPSGYVAGAPMQGGWGEAIAQAQLPTAPPMATGMAQRMMEAKAQQKMGRPTGRAMGRGRPMGSRMLGDLMQQRQFQR